MTRLVFHHNHQLLPPASENQLPVQLYGLSGQSRGDVSVIGNSILDKVQRLGVQIPPQVMDFLTIALAVTAADAFVHRSASEDGWARQFTLELPLHEPARWIAIKKDLEQALHFLSGDMWNFEFQEGGHPPPVPYSHRGRFHLIRLRELDCVSLFSGGLDSAIGVIDLLAQGRSPLMVSHAYKGDKKHQEQIAEALKGRRSRFEVNADPHFYAGDMDITMRTRSLNFLAFAAVAASAVQAVSQQSNVDLFVPENGFISLNAPLTPRRIGTLSTRTTHPHFIESIQDIFTKTEIHCRIINPYQFKTKGQMISHCQDKSLLTSIVDSTVSCSHWKRSNQQCGICVPCLVRRAALHSSGVSESMNYAFNSVTDILKYTNRRDDLLALRIAVTQKKARGVGSWIIDSGPLSTGMFERFQKVFLDGLDEIEALLKAEGAL